MTSESDKEADESLIEQIEEEIDKESLIEQIEEEIDKEITDPIKESTVDYYLKTKDQVMS